MVRISNPDVCGIDVISPPGVKANNNLLVRVRIGGEVEVGGGRAIPVACNIDRFDVVPSSNLCWADW